MKDLKSENNKNKKIFEILMAVSISIVVMLLGIYYIPFIIFLYPIPFIVLGVKYGIKINIATMVISIFVIGLLTDNLSGIFILLTFLPLNVSLTYSIRNRKKSLETMAISTLVLSVSFFIILGIMKDMTGVSIINQLDDFFTQALNTQLEIAEEMELSSYEIFEFKDFMEDRFNDFLLTTPSIIMIFSLIIAYINYLISVLALRKLGYGIVYTPRFSKFKLPNNILLGIGIMFLGTFLLKVFEFSHYETIFKNITLLASFVFLVQGLAVIDYRLIKKNRNWFLRVLTIIFFGLLSLLRVATTFVGVLDVIFDFRKPKKTI